MEHPILFGVHRVRGPEQDTRPRFSFSQSEARRRDFIVNHPSGNQRLVEYPTPDMPEIDVRTRLQKAGLILGVQLNSEDRLDYFRIPASSRPIVYDLKSDAQGAFSYGDDQLFFDIGELLGLVCHETDGKVLSGGIGLQVALVEFTRTDERRLYFIPGVESSIKETNGMNNPTDFYAQKLSSEFGDRFENYAEYFRMGFAEASQE
ncbi:MAG: hypothetical protein WCJ24_00965 [Candidatus Saccharibacteria bacterium]